MNLASQSHTGWKAIAKRLGVKDVRTARKWAKKYQVPIIIMGRTPMLDEAIFRVWQMNYWEALKLEDLREKDKESAEAVVES